MNRLHTISTLIFISLVGTLTQICTDIYTPSLPAIAFHFHTSMGNAQLTLSCFIAGIALTTLMYGPISEIIGRRDTLIMGMGVAILGTLTCLWSLSIHELQWGRLLQGAGVGASSALWRSIFRDRFSGKTMVRLSGYLVNIVVLSLIIAPILGGHLQEKWGWQANFLFLLLWMMIIMLVLYFFLPETNQYHHKSRSSLRFILKTYQSLLCDIRFMLFSSLSFICYGGLVIWLATSPIILIHHLGLRPSHFGYLMMVTGLGTGLSGWANNRLIKSISLENIILIGAGLIGTAGVAFILLYISLGLNTWSILAPGIAMILGSTLIFMNAFGLAFAQVGTIAGYASALYACIQLAGGVVFSAIVSHLNNSTPVVMGGFLTIIGLLAAIVCLVAKSHPLLDQTES